MHLITQTKVHFDDIFLLWRERDPGGHFLVMGQWRCAAEWGRNFTTGLTVKGLHFQWSYQNGVAHFRDWWLRIFR